MYTSCIAEHSGWTGWVGNSDGEGERGGKGMTECFHEHNRRRKRKRKRKRNN
jgi:hypothetical protein